MWEVLLEKHKAEYFYIDATIDEYITHLFIYHIPFFLGSKYVHYISSSIEQKKISKGKYNISYLTDCNHIYTVREIL